MRSSRHGRPCGGGGQRAIKCSISRCACCRLGRRLGRHWPVRAARLETASPADYRPGPVVAPRTRKRRARELRAGHRREEAAAVAAAAVNGERKEELSFVQLLSSSFVCLIKQTKAEPAPESSALIIAVWGSLCLRPRRPPPRRKSLAGH